MKSLKLATPSRTMLVHVFEARVRKVGHDHMQAVVDARLALGLLPPGIERRAHPRSARLHGEVDDRSRPADGRRPCAGFEIVADVVPPNGMSRWVCASIAARQDEQPRCIHNFFRRASRNPALTSLMVSPSISKSAFTLASAFTTVPFRISVEAISFSRSQLVSSLERRQNPRTTVLSVDFHFG